MKQAARFCCTVTMLLLLFPAAHGETLRYSIRDLPGVTSPRWEQTYSAYGRTVEVNEDIVIPNVENMPVISARKMPALSSDICDRMNAQYAQMVQTPSKYNQPFCVSSDYQSVLGISPIWPVIETKTMGQEFHELIEFDPNTAYADANTVTISEAILIAQDRVRDAFPDMRLHLHTAFVWDRPHYRVTGKPVELYASGYYSLQFGQVFHGIPFLASIHQAFYNLEVGNEDSTLDRRGFASVNVFNAIENNAICRFYEETGVLYDDIPLLPFDTVKPQVEALIVDGHIRMIANINLGYVQYDTQNPDEMALIPAWVVWCQYDRKGGSVGQDEDLINSDPFDSYNYRPLIFNAQTGEMVNPENETYGRCQCPAIITW